jgi:hypothetical protein
MRKPEARDPFFIPAFLFSIAALLQILLDFTFPLPLSILAQYWSEPLPNAIGLIVFLLTLAGLLTFAWPIAKRGTNNR